ncbi:MAG: RecT family recombinase, partial [Fibrobacter sp.]|nr:RecT family recombinase [Fibrobacter sp.]
KDGGYDLSIVTGYEVYLKRAEMNPNYDGFNIEFKGSFKRGKVTKQGKNGPWQVDALVPDGEVSCVCTVYRKDRAHPIREEVYFDEYDQGNSMWQSKPRTMLKKVAIVSAFRKAFPIDFGGMPYTNDELPDNMTGAEKLQEQGYTEVPTEMPKQVAQTAPVADDAEDFEAFKNAIVPLAHKNSQLYRMVMAAHKYKNLESIPRDSRREFFMELNQAINPPQQQQPKSAPTAAEQTEVQDV